MTVLRLTQEHYAGAVLRGDLNHVPIMSHNHHDASATALSYRDRDRDGHPGRRRHGYTPARAEAAPSANCFQVSDLVVDRRPGLASSADAETFKP